MACGQAIDCTMGLTSMSRVLPPDDEDDDDDDRDDNNNNNNAKQEKSANKSGATLSLSGLLNFVDGLWSSCGDERIIIFTTNHKERLDPALLRPGRMDMHIHMSYLTMSGFRALARNYLGVSEEHALFGEIEQLLETKDVSPAQLAEALTRSEDVDIALSGVVEMLKTPKIDPTSSIGKRKETLKKRKQPVKVSAKPRTSKRQKKSTKAGTGSKTKPECC